MSNPPSLSFTLFRTYLKFYFQTRRFYAMLILYLFIVLLVPALTLTNVIGKSPEVSSFLAIPIGFFGEVATLGSALLAGDAISQDFSRQGLFTLSQPFGRARIMLTRYSAAIAASVGLALVYFALTAGMGYAFYGELTPNYLEMVGYAILYVAALVAFVMLCSSLFKSSSISIVVAVLIVILAMPIATGILEVTSIEPWFFITYAASAIPGLSASTYPQHLQTITEGPVTVSIYVPTLLEAAVIMAAYLAVSLVISLAIYNRKELRET